MAPKLINRGGEVQKQLYLLREKAVKSLKTMLLGLLALALVIQPNVALCNHVNMDGLIESESFTYTRDNVRVEHEFDAQNIDKALNKADELTKEVAKLYGKILTNAERDEGNHFRTWDKERYQAMKMAAASFQNRMQELHQELTAASALFKVAFKEKLPREVHIEIIERAGHYIRNVTIYNSYVDFGANRKLRFDTMTPFDEAKADILRDHNISYLDFPTVLLPQAVGAVATGQARANGGLVHERSSLTITSTVVHLPLDMSKLTKLLEGAETAIKKASLARENIVGAGVREITRTLYGRDRKSVEYNCKLDTFEKTHKPHIIDYITSMVELKAYCNELAARLNVSKNYISALNVRGDYEKVKSRFEELSRWGDAWVVTYDPWNRCERWFKFFPGEDFTKRNIYNEMSVKTPTEVALAREEAQRMHNMRKSGMISTKEAIRLLNTMDVTYRYSKARKLAVKIYDLNTSNAISIGNTFQQFCRDEWVEYVVTLPNFSSN